MFDEEDSFSDLCFHSDGCQKFDLHEISKEAQDICERLTISNFRLTSFPQVVESMGKLCYLNLSFNRIVSICEIRLPFLKVLDVSHNRLVTIPFLQCCSLSTLRCQNNDIESLQDLFLLSNLSEFWISQNNIPWLQFYNVLRLPLLSTLVKHGNPSDEMQKLDQFLFSLNPSLESIDGVRCDGKGSGQRQDFIKSTDGRLMVNQFRTHLSVEQRKILASLLTNIAETLDRDRTHEEPSVISVLATNVHVSPAGKVAAAKTGREAKSTDTKKSHSNHSLPRKFVPDFDMEQQQQEGRSGSESSQIIRFGAGEESPVALCIYSSGAGYVRWSKGGPVACSLEGGRLFCSFRSGAIACILDPRGSGSVMDPRGRCVLLLCEGEDERGGRATATAKVLDPATGAATASYVKPDPASLQYQQQMMLTDEGGSGGGPAEFSQIVSPYPSPFQSPSPTPSPLDGGDEGGQYSEIVGDIVSPLPAGIGKGKEKSTAKGRGKGRAKGSTGDDDANAEARRGDNETSTGPGVHKWTFDGIRVEFSAPAWDNERVIGEVSSVTGTKLVKEFPIETSSGGGGGRGGGGGGAEKKRGGPRGMGGRGGPVLSDTEHSALRSDLQSVMAGLDDMLAGFSRIAKN